MKLDGFESALRRQPFRRFEIRAGGEPILVEHPQRVLLAMEKTVAVITCGDRFHIVDVDQIKKLAFVRRRTRRKAK